MNFPKYIKIVEVGLRDGLQNEDIIISTKDKLCLVELLIKSGVSNIELTSFVNPKIIPQLSDAELLLEEVPWDKDIAYSALVPNIKGFERAQQTKLREITVFVSASESHNKANVNCSIDESLKKIEEICLIAKNKKIKLRGEIAVSFGCPFEGTISSKNLLDMVRRLYGMGCNEIALGDTIGVANPKQVYDIFNLIGEKIPGLIMAAHLHDTNRRALANVLAAMFAGVEIFDSAIGGLGGCPFAPGATGNISTENLVLMLNKMGISTGIEIKQLINCVGLVEKLLKKRIDLIPELQKLKNN